MHRYAVYKIITKLIIQILTTLTLLLRFLVIYLAYFCILQLIIFLLTSLSCFIYHIFYIFYSGSTLEFSLNLYILCLSFFLLIKPFLHDETTEKIKLILTFFVFESFLFPTLNSLRRLSTLVQQAY